MDATEKVIEEEGQKVARACSEAFLGIAMLAVLGLFVGILFECLLLVKTQIQLTKFERHGGVVGATTLREEHQAYKIALSKGDNAGIDLAQGRLAHSLAEQYRNGMVSGWFIEVCVAKGYVPKETLSRYEPDFRWAVDPKGP